MKTPLTYRPKSPDTNIGGYRYFFNGQEADNEVFGENGLFAFEYRMHDTRIGRFWSVDPLAGKFPWNSTSAFAENMPIWARELEGLEADKSYSGSGWGHNARRKIAFFFNVDENVNGIVGAGVNSLLQSGSVTVTGKALDKIKNDPKMLEFEERYLQNVRSNSKFGKQDFQETFRNCISFGGERAPAQMKDQFFDFLNPEYRDTWKVAANELTWLIRNVNVTTKVCVSKTGDVTMYHSFTDILDLRPNPERSKEYNITTTVLGFFYHDLIGGNDKMTVKASWTSEHPNDKTKTVKDEK